MKGRHLINISTKLVFKYVDYVIPMYNTSTTPPILDAKVVFVKTKNNFGALNVK